MRWMIGILNNIINLVWLIECFPSPYTYSDAEKMTIEFLETY